MTLPPPLRGSEIPSFTHYSIVTRLPEIARRTLAENAFSADVVARIEALIAEIPSGLIRPLMLHAAPDASAWDAYTAPSQTLNWLQIPWFFAEEYFYERILEATGYFDPASAGFGVDPYAHQKRLGLETTLTETHLLADTLEAWRALPLRERIAALPALLLADLWGNQNDLSMWPAAHPSDASPHPPALELPQKTDTLLADDRTAALDYLLATPPANRQMDLLLDNAGYELVCDLALADFLLNGLAERVILHVKPRPVFVSDAMPADVTQTIARLQAEPHPATQKFASRLSDWLQTGRLLVREHPFWVSPLPIWNLPPALSAALEPSTLLISKGDANYRRLLGDRHWQHSLPFAEVMRGSLPCPVLAMRTLKSEITVGIRTPPTTDPEWMINGRWGLIQFAKPS